MSSPISAHLVDGYHLHGQPVLINPDEIASVTVGYRLGVTGHGEYGSIVTLKSGEYHHLDLSVHDVELLWLASV